MPDRPRTEQEILDLVRNRGAFLAHLLPVWLEEAKRSDDWLCAVFIAYRGLRMADAAKSLFEKEATRVIKRRDLSYELALHYISTGLYPEASCWICRCICEWKEWADFADLLVDYCTVYAEHDLRFEGVELKVATSLPHAVRGLIFDLSSNPEKTLEEVYPSINLEWADDYSCLLVCRSQLLPHDTLESLEYIGRNKFDFPVSHWLLYALLSNGVGAHDLTKHFMNLATPGGLSKRMLALAILAIGANAGFDAIAPFIYCYVSKDDASMRILQGCLNLALLGNDKFLVESINCHAQMKAT